MGWSISSFIGAPIAFLLFPDTDWKIADSRLTDEAPSFRPRLRPALIDAGWPDTPPEFRSILKRRVVQLQGCQALAGDALPSGPCRSGQGDETKGVVLVVNGNPAILYPEAAKRE